MRKATGYGIMQRIVYANAYQDDVNKAVKAARAALSGEWAKMGSKGRRNLLLRLADVFHKHAHDLGRLERYI